MNTTRTAAPVTTPAEYAAVTDALRVMAVPAADFDRDAHIEAITALSRTALTEYEDVVRLATAGCITPAERLDSLRGFVARRDALHASWI